MKLHQRLILAASSALGGAIGAAVYAWEYTAEPEREQPRPQVDPSEPLSLDATYNEADGSFQVTLWGGTSIEQDVAMLTWQMSGNDWQA